MGAEEFMVIVRGHNGRGKRQFRYYVDPRKKPNAESVLKDFRLDSQIDDERHWRLCTLNGKEIRWLCDYADRVLVLEPTTIRNGAGPTEALLPRLDGQSPKLAIRNHAISGHGPVHAGDSPLIVSTTIVDSHSPERGRRPRPHHRSESSSIVSVSSTPKLPSLSTSSSSGSNLLSSKYSAVSNKGSEQRRSRVSEVLPKARDSRPGHLERGSRYRRERSR